MAPFSSYARSIWEQYFYTYKELKPKRGLGPYSDFIAFWILNIFISFLVYIIQISYMLKKQFQFSSLQLLSQVWLFDIPWTAACQASLSVTKPRSLLKLMSTESMMPSNHLILCCPLLLLTLIFHSLRVFSNESILCIRWPSYWSFSFSINPSNEYSGLISFRIDWLDFLAVQGTLKSLPQHHISKASILWCSAFFTVQLWHPYTTTGKTIALTRWPLLAK